MRNTGSRRGTARSRENAPLLENGRRAAALPAVTDCVIATAAKNQIDQTASPGSLNATTGKTQTGNRPRPPPAALKRTARSLSVTTQSYQAALCAPTFRPTAHPCRSERADLRAPARTPAANDSTPESALGAQGTDARAWQMRTFRDGRLPSLTVVLWRVRRGGDMMGPAPDVNTGTGGRPGEGCPLGVLGTPGTRHGSDTRWQALDPAGRWPH
jgi:hypothetical protein